MSNSERYNRVTRHYPEMRGLPSSCPVPVALGMALVCITSSAAAQTAERFDLTLGVERAASSPYYDGPQYAPAGTSAGVRRLTLQPQPRLLLSADLRLRGTLALTAGGYFGKGTVTDRYCANEGFLCSPDRDRDVTNIGMELGLALTMPWQPLGALKLRAGVTREMVSVGKFYQEHGEEKFPMSGVFVGASFRRNIAGPVYLELGALYRRLSVATEKIAEAQQKFCGFCTREYEATTARSASLRFGAGAGW